MSISVLDILIDEVANSLGITKDEVRNKFTKKELEDLLSNSLCEPLANLGIPIDGLDSFSCDDLAIPNLDKPISEEEIAAFQKEIQDEISKKSSHTPCLDTVDEVNQELEKQLDLYIEHKILLEKLIEYQDNYSTVGEYYVEKSNECARLFKEFEPLLTETKRISAQINAYYTELSTAVSNNDQIKIAQLQEKINTSLDSLRKANSTIAEKEKNYPIFGDSTFKIITNYISDPANSSSTLSEALSSLSNQYLGRQSLSQIDLEFRKYSECISIETLNRAPSTIQEAIDQNFINFSLDFVKLNSVTIDKESVDKKTGKKIPVKKNVLIKDSSLLQATSFFENAAVFRLTEKTLAKDQELQGTLYTQYYNLLNDPINRLFSIDERGLTTSIDLVDPKVRGTSSEKKREGKYEYYVKDLDTMTKFYEDFEKTFENKKNSIRKSVIEPAQNSLKTILQRLAQKEVQYILAVGGVNRSLEKDSSLLTSIREKMARENDAFTKRVADLDAEITRIKQKVEELKPNPDKVKELLKKKNPTCFGDSDRKHNVCNDTKKRLGIDPLYLKTLDGVDPTLPNCNQLCYWQEFATIINLIGLLPVPNVPNSTELRYWPVGLIVPTPGGLIKVPLPIIWKPLVVLSSPMGTIVIFLTVNGIFVSPVVFFVSSTGFKQHIFTIRGASNKFGYSANDESIKSNIYVPLIISSAKSKVIRLAKEKELGKNYYYTAEQIKQLNLQKNILKAAESSAKSTNNQNKLLRLKREKKNLERAEKEKKLTDLEKTENIINKEESVKDLIDDARQAILKRIDELGKPALGRSNKLKDKIKKRNDKLVSKLQSSLENGDINESETIREKLKTDGLQMAEKINAIQSDMLSFFDRIKFPIITIPKDAAKIEPKQNAIIDFLQEILNFSSIYKTKFFSPDDGRVQRILLIELAKRKASLKKIGAKYSNNSGTIDIETESDKIKQFLRDINKSLIDAVSGLNDQGDLEEQQKKVTILQEQVKKEKDPTKRLKLSKKLQKEQIKQSELFENKKTRDALNITPELMLALSQISINFDPFASCCNAKSFSFTPGLSPAIPIFQSALALLNTFVNGLSSDQLIALFGGQRKISVNEILTAYIAMIIKSVPYDLVIPLPSLNLITFAKSVAKLLLSMFEPKAPNPALQPALPKSITIDLNILKKPLLTLLLAYLKNCLPDPNVSSDQTDQSLTQGSQYSQLGQEIKIINCETDNTQSSKVASAKNTDPTQELKPGLKISEKGSLIQSTSFDLSMGNVVIATTKDILPAFRHLETNFIDLNPGDLLVVIKNFIDLNFDKVQSLLEPFYRALKLIKSAKGMNLNVIESAQHAIPPYGPAIKLLDTAISKAKQSLKRSATTKVIDQDILNAKKAVIEKSLSPIANSPIPHLTIASAGALDSSLPNLKVPKIDIATGTFTTEEKKASTLAIRNLHPVVSQDDIPPWERLSSKNILFLLFVDEFISTGADQVGFFRSYI